MSIIDDVRHGDSPRWGHEFEVVEWEDYTYVRCVHCGDAILDADDYRNNGKMCPYR